MPLVCLGLGARKHILVEGSWDGISTTISLQEALEVPLCFKDEETEVKNLWAHPSSPVCHPVHALFLHSYGYSENIISPGTLVAPEPESGRWGACSVSEKQAQLLLAAVFFNCWATWARLTYPIPSHVQGLLP